MGKKKRKWQDIRHVLGYFGQNYKEARRNYLSYMEKGISIGRRPELVGGGLIRSLGGWDEVKKLRLNGQDRVKGDERILGESDFVNDILSEAGEEYSRGYELKTQGVDLETIIEKVSSICRLDRKYILGKGRQKDRVEARDLVCYWASNELGVSITDLAKTFGMTAAGASYAVRRGETIAVENKWQLSD